MARRRDSKSLKSTLAFESKSAYFVLSTPIYSLTHWKKQLGVVLSWQAVDGFETAGGVGDGYFNVWLGFGGLVGVVPPDGGFVGTVPPEPPLTDKFWTWGVRAAPCASTICRSFVL